MKGLLQYILLILAGCLYLTPALELDSKECKQNYAKENHFSICLTSDTYQFSNLEVAAALPAYILSCRFAEQILQQTYTLLSAVEPDPPERLYLHHSVFLI